MPPKWSSGRACGAASTTQRTRSIGEDGKEKRCMEGAKRLAIIICVFSKSASEGAKVVPKTKPNHRNDAGTVPFEARGVHKLKKQARTAP